MLTKEVTDEVLVLFNSEKLLSNERNEYISSDVVTRKDESEAESSSGSSASDSPPQKHKKTCKNWSRDSGCLAAMTFHSICFQQMTALQE
jgi:hypothetical protein